MYNINKILPKIADNNYSGHPLAKWVFIILIIPTVIRSLIHMFAPDSGAQSIATIPLGMFTHNGAAAVILMLALWGSAQLLMALVYIVVVWRYQSLIPFMYVLMILEYALRMLLMHIKPIHIAGIAPGDIADYIIIPVATFMLILSLIDYAKIHPKI